MATPAIVAIIAADAAMLRLMAHADIAAIQ